MLRSASESASGGPPRARRSPPVAPGAGSATGWTSARAEEPSAGTSPWKRAGGPPRARRSPTATSPTPEQRWTSARAEEPHPTGRRDERTGVDLRARGGATKPGDRARTIRGGPPRARRSPTRPSGRRSRAGWTSARAEEPRWRRTRRRNQGGPPRARRSPVQDGKRTHQQGWTSARAEEPPGASSRISSYRVDLRARGGAGGSTWPTGRQGGPPRARRSRRDASEHDEEVGWTSARAEEPPGPERLRVLKRVDLRARGGAAESHTQAEIEAGGPPRARRSRGARRCAALRCGWTSARAEEPLRRIVPDSAMLAQEGNGRRPELHPLGARTGPRQLQLSKIGGPPPIADDRPVRYSTSRQARGGVRRAP